MKRKYVKVTPETYRKYRPCFEPYKGDIVAFESNIYIDFPGGTWQDHFTRKTILATCADTVPSNSGRFKAKTKKKNIFNFLYVPQIKYMYIRA